MIFFVQRFLEKKYRIKISIKFHNRFHIYTPEYFITKHKSILGNHNIPIFYQFMSLSAFHMILLIACHFPSNYNTETAKEQKCSTLFPVIPV